jgi:hypothetical protein
MQIPLSELHSILGALRTVAEKDTNDIIANCASDLVVRLESLNATFGTTAKNFSAVDQQLIEYATKKPVDIKLLTS